MHPQQSSDLSYPVYRFWGNELPSLATEYRRDSSLRNASELSHLSTETELAPTTGRRPTDQVRPFDGSFLSAESTEAEPIGSTT